MSQTPDANFWWTWSVQLAAAVGTFLAIVVALFGDLIRRKFWPPRLVMELSNPEGFRQSVEIQSDGVSDFTVARFYHVRVANRRRWAPANGVRVYVTQIAEPDASGRLAPRLIAPLPMRWRGWEQSAHDMRTVGSAAEIDLCSVLRSHQAGRPHSVEIHSLLSSGGVELHHQTPFKMILTLVAQSIEADSPPLNLEISWDGNWLEDSADMRHHLIIKPLNQ